MRQNARRFNRFTPSPLFCPVSRALSRRDLKSCGSTIHIAFSR
jgi:hypothetical protein